MSLFCRNGKINSITMYDVGAHALSVGICTFFLAGGLNDIYCATILKKKRTNDINIRFYRAKYTNIFLVLATLSGMCIGGRFGYTKIPLLVGH